MPSVSCYYTAQQHKISFDCFVSFRFADLIDVVKDQLPTASDYVKEEDPCVYISRKTGRGPLSDSWIQDYWRECKVGLYIERETLEMILINSCMYVGSKVATVQWKGHHVRL